ncbi:hypothetical protein RJ640_023716 [Escallonia rubra]|uniref:Reverse transcriptase Ty1/copia-type domain-containing protein n=1 Tax=Escallonia rubra TaxID=112253 RepID=A0AA88R3H6_9ASTE|nr:hypothetical protein RJ640_023716 [Escallonia rubra]
MFVPVIRMEIIRMVLGFAAQQRLFVYQLDVQSTLLNAQVEEKIFNNENFTRRQIFPFSKSNLAPVTIQCPGVSSGPLQICDMSTNFKSFCVCTGTGGPAG